MNIYLVKYNNGLFPADDNSKSAINKMKSGQLVRAKVTKPRNYAFHRKYFALLSIAFDNWDPPETSSPWGVPVKNFDRFRRDVAILAGYYETYVRIDGSVRVEPRSISFAKMSAEEFEDLYSKTIDVLIKHVYGSAMKPDRINKIVEEYLSFV